MDDIFYFVAQQGTPIKLIIVFLVIALILFIRKKRMQMYKPVYTDGNMPANVWFYSKLIDIEIGTEKATHRQLYRYFMEYLHRKYKIKKADLKKNTIYEIVANSENDENIINLYDEIYNDIDELKQKNKTDVIEYIKMIKPLFNKDNIDDWIKENKEKKCDDC